ncbi:MAG: PDZ domain-containing protein [Candidatus Latescibacterota bacterium]|nr:MAG: PDZ domain-containing protein [Candidatus Latescibacterota bacterium]
MTRTFKYAMTGRRVIGLIGLAILIVAFLGAGLAEAGKSKDKSKDVYIYAGKDKKDTAYLGVKMQKLDDKLRKGLDIKVKKGVLISEVIEGSPAQEAGIEDGDVIIEFDGKEVDTPSTLQELVADTEIGETVKVKVLRDNRTKTFKVAVGEWPEEQFHTLLAPEHSVWLDKGHHWLLSSLGKGRLGVRVEDLDEDLASYFGVDEGEGVLVLGVSEESAAEEMGIKSGDVIVKVEDDEIGSAEELREAIRDIDEGDEFEVTVVRKNKQITLEGEMPESAASIYLKGLKGRRHKVEMPHIEAFEIPETDLGELKAEIKELKKEIEELKKEIKKVERKRR